MITKVEAIKRQIEKLTPPQKLRLAADLLEAQRPDMAHVIAERVVLDLGAVLALARMEDDSDV